jgi:hypothetical protein
MPKNHNKKLPRARPQPEYIPPSKLVKFSLHPSQDRFWLKISDWFKAHYEFNEKATGDNNEAEMENCRAMKRKIPEPYQRKVWDVRQSAWQAFQIAQGKDLGVETKTFPRGAGDDGEYRHDERTKGLALYLLKCGFPLWNDRVEAGLQQAIKENNVEYFRRDIPETLNGRRKSECFDPDKPSLLGQWLISLWCPGDYWPEWADPKIPPLCIFTDQATADFLTLIKIDSSATSFDAVRKARQTLKLVQFTEPARIKNVRCENGQFRFS